MLGYLARRTVQTVRTDTIMLSLPVSADNVDGTNVVRELPPAEVPDYSNENT
jgi:hypothetical protein